MLLFDMDGTLTDARKPIDKKFAAELIELCKRVPCYVVTGSDYEKVLEQLGLELTNALETVFACNGNVGYNKQRVVKISDAYKWKLNEKQLERLDQELQRSKFWLRTGNHIEQRIGCANFSIVGRNANHEQRGYYKFWDMAHGERDEVIARLRKRKAMAGVEFVKGGETGIDIYPAGFSKAQVRPWLTGPVTFIGDRCEPGGNDYDIALACDRYFHVRNWQETRNLLATY